MKDQIFKLDPTSKKFTCPHCGRSKKWVRYINIETREYLPESFGRCDREDRCHAHVMPSKEFVKEYFTKKKSSAHMPFPYQKPPPVKKEVKTFIPRKVLKKTRNKYSSSDLYIALEHSYHKIKLKEAFELYRLGCYSEGYMKGAVTFPYIDKDENVHAVQAIKYYTSGENAGHRIKTRTNFIHSLLFKWYKEMGKPIPSWLKDYIDCTVKKISCLFGEHLLNRFTHNPVVIVEAPKTAIVMTLRTGLPTSENDPIFLAAFNSSGLNLEKLKVLEGKNIFIYPDQGAYHKWKKKMEDIQKLMPETRFYISDILEKNASTLGINSGDDIADISLESDFNNDIEIASEALKEVPVEDTSATAQFLNRLSSSMKEKIEIFQAKGFDFEILQYPMHNNSEDDLTQKGEIWDLTEFDELIENGKKIQTPQSLETGMTIKDVNKFIEGHLSVLRANNGKKQFLPYFERLRALKELIFQCSPV